MVLDNVGPGNHSLTIVIHALVGVLSAGNFFLIRLHERVNRVSAIVELEGDGQNSSEEPCTVAIGFVFFEGGD